MIQEYMEGPGRNPKVPSDEAHIWPKNRSEPGELGRAVLDMIRDAEGQLDVTSDMLHQASRNWPHDAETSSYLMTMAAFVAGQRQVLQMLMQTIVEAGAVPRLQNPQNPG